MIQLPDALAISLIVGAAAAFIVGQLALAAAEDLYAIYWLAVGTACIRAAVHIARPGAKT